MDGSPRGRRALWAAGAAVAVLAVVARVAVSGAGARTDGLAALAAGDELGGTVLLREAVAWYLPVAAPWREEAAQALWDLHARQLAEGRVADAVRSLESLRAGIWAAASVLRPDEGWRARVDAALPPLLARWEAEAAEAEGRASPGPLAERVAHFAALGARDPRPSRAWGLLGVLGFFAWVAGTLRGIRGEGRARWVALGVALAGFCAFAAGMAFA